MPANYRLSGARAENIAGSVQEGRNTFRQVAPLRRVLRFRRSRDGRRSVDVVNHRLAADQDVIEPSVVHAHLVAKRFYFRWRDDIYYLAADRVSAFDDRLFAGRYDVKSAVATDILGPETV